MTKILAAALVSAALLGPSAARANHAGCLATPATPSCTYTAVGSHQCIGFSEATWSVTVTRVVGGEEQEVVLAGGQGAIVGDGVDAFFGETATLTINGDGPGGAPLGVVSCGNTAGHP